MSEPAQRPGKSRQDYETPPEFIRAVEDRFGALNVDLAARNDNAKAPQWITPEADGLSTSWPTEGTLWLNPPFGKIEPWAKRCWDWAPPLDSSGRGRILLLVPASVGSRWFSEYVMDGALVLFLQPRLSFDGKAPFPRDCMLCVYGELPGFEVWKWK